MYALMELKVYGGKEKEQMKRLHEQLQWNTMITMIKNVWYIVYKEIPEQKYLSVLWEEKK